ncbi:MAG: hypothetical protein PHG95_02085 [Patescibacteria group bacterium]|nr:hypothetical protein [Patescibacteria group bacterium]
MNFLAKSYFFSFVAAAAFLFFLAAALPASAAVCNLDTKLDVVARDPGGSYISGIKAELYYQVTDANGKPKPGTRAASASANTSTGIATLKFRNSNAESGIYALKIQSITKDVTSYWYYNLELSCGQQLSIEKILSGINFVLRDYDGNLLYNTSFNVYTQNYDLDGNPIKQTKDLVATLNTGTSGGARIYVPQGSVRSLDGSRSDDYVLELTRNGHKFDLYDIKVRDELLTNSEYYSSAVKVTLRTVAGALFPGKTKVEVYEQGIDGNNDEIQGDKVGEFQTSDDGYGIFEYPAGVYVLGVKGSNGQYDYLWDVEILDGQLNEYDWQVGSSWQSGTETCSDTSKLTVNLIGMGGEALSGFKYEIYEQDVDVFARPIAGKKIGSGTTNSAGKAELSFKPDPRKSYALKAYDKKSDLGEFWFFDAARFVCGYDRTITKSLPYLKVVLRDASGNLKKDFSFSLYEESFDADNRPVKDTKKLIATLKTGSNGAAIIYVAPAHPFNQTKRGLYIFSATVNKSVFDAYNIAIDANKNATFEYVFSDLSLSVKSAAGQAAANTEVKLYAQTVNGSAYSLGDLLSSGKTDSSGNLHLEYPAGTYALVVADAFKRNNIFWNAVIKDRQANKANLSLSVTRATLASALGELMPANTVLKVYSLYESGGYFYKDKEVGSIKLAANKQGEALLADGPYLLSYIDKNKTEYGQAFWAQNGKIKTVSLKMEKAQQIEAGQKFSLSRPALSVAMSLTSTSSSSASSSTASGSLEKRLAGYILLQVEDKGQAWYLNPKNSKRYYLADGAAAYQIMRQTGVGITDDDLRKIPIGVDSRFAGDDSDGDLLPDGLEVSIGSNPSNSDSDGDGYLDGEELRAGYNPLGAGALSYDFSFAAKQKGKILLQVQKNGEAWYVNPQDGKRYYLGNGDLAFQIMRYLSLGISNQDLSKISVGQ